MKHATYILVLAAGALGACGRNDAQTQAANNKAAQGTALPSDKAVDPATDSRVARTPVPPERTQPPMDPKVVDARSTSTADSAPSIVDDRKDSDAGQSDSLTQPGVLNALPPLGTGPNGAAAMPADKAPLALGAMDAEFVTKAVIGGLFEVQSSELAVSQATTPFVREFAQMMVLDHGDAGRGFEVLARGKGAIVPRDLDEEHASRLVTLRDQKGIDFDRQYRDMQITAHKDAIALFDRAAATCEDAELKAYAAKLLPKLREHQQKLNEMPPTQG